jgi:hypothetical protein
MTELALPLTARLKRDVYTDAAAAVFAAGLLVWGFATTAGDADATPAVAMATTVALMLHRLTGHCRVTWFDQHVEVRNPGFTTIIPRGEIVMMANIQVTRGIAPHVVLRDGRSISCATLPDHAWRLSKQYVALPNAPRGPVRNRVQLCWYDTLWLIICATGLATAAILH